MDIEQREAICASCPYIEDDKRCNLLMGECRIELETDVAYCEELEQRVRLTSGHLKEYPLVSDKL